MSQEQDVSAFLEHHGVKGMRWGHHKAHIGAETKPSGKVAKYQGKSDRAVEKINQHATSISNIQSHIDDAKLHGMNAELLAKHYGPAQTRSETLHKTVTGETHAQTVANHISELEAQKKEHEKAILLTAAKQHHYDAKAAKAAKHSGVDDFLAYYGIELS